VLGIQELNVAAALLAGRSDLLAHIYEDDQVLEALNEEEISEGCPPYRKASLLDLAIRFGHIQIAEGLAQQGITLQRSLGRVMSDEVRLEAAVAAAYFCPVVNATLQNWKGKFVWSKEDVSLLDWCLFMKLKMLALKLWQLAVPVITVLSIHDNLDVERLQVVLDLAAMSTKQADDFPHSADILGAVRLHRTTTAVKSMYDPSPVASFLDLAIIGGDLAMAASLLQLGIPSTHWYTLEDINGQCLSRRMRMCEGFSSPVEFSERGFSAIQLLMLARSDVHRIESSRKSKLGTC